MTPLRALADRLDAWADASSIALTENAGILVVRQLTGDMAKELLALLEAAGWVEAEAYDAGGEIAAESLTGDTTGVTVSVRMPDTPAGVERIFTRTAFEAALKRLDSAARLWVFPLDQPIETRGVRYGPWEDADRTDAPIPCSDPRKVVRTLGVYSQAEADLSRWILVDPTTWPLSANAAVLAWRRQASLALAKALANEIEPDGRLLFRGPPVSRFTIAATPTVDDDGFVALQRAVDWTYLNRPEVENRHGLIAAEIARSALRDGDLRGLGEVASAALEGARIAYSFGVQQQSRDTLKALSDLRRAVLDETAKASDITRGLASAVAGAVFGGIGVIVARLTLPANAVFVGNAALFLGVVLLLYVAATIASGGHFLIQQRKLREHWKPKLYSFLTKSEYEALVSKPVKSAETAFWVAAGVGGLMTLLLFVAVFYISRTPILTSPPIAPPTPTIAAPPAPRVVIPRPPPTSAPATQGSAVRITAPT